MDLAGEDLVEHGPKRVGALGPRERERTGDRLVGVRAERDQQGVVLDATAFGELDGVTAEVDGRHTVASQARTCVVDQRSEGEAARIADAKRLGDRERPVDEIVLRGDHLDRDPVLG